MRIREIRESKKLLQKDVAAHLGIARNTYCQYETGKRTPDFATTMRIADFFGVSVDYLLGCAGNEKGGISLFCERLKELRKKNNLTQHALSSCLDISTSAVAMWETGKREPDMKTLSRIADFFCVSADYLLGRDDCQVPEKKPLLSNDCSLTSTASYHALRETASLISHLSDEGLCEALRYLHYLTFQQRTSSPNSK